MAWNDNREHVSTFKFEVRFFFLLLAFFLISLITTISGSTCPTTIAPSTGKKDRRQHRHDEWEAGHCHCHSHLDTSANTRNINGDSGDDDNDGDGRETNPRYVLKYIFYYYANVFTVYIATIYCDKRTGGNQGDKGRGLRCRRISSPRYVFFNTFIY